MFRCKVVGLSCVCLSTVNCNNPGKLAGSGLVAGEEDHIAAFEFNTDNCDDPTHPSGRFDYVDKYAGAKLDGLLTAIGLCVRPEQWRGEWFELDCSLCADLVGLPSYVAYFDYRSLSPAMPGEGQGLVCLTSNRQGASASDSMFVWVTSGPHMGYERLGPVQANLQQRSCDE